MWLSATSSGLIDAIFHLVTASGALVSGCNQRNLSKLQPFIENGRSK